MDLAQARFKANYETYRNQLEGIRKSLNEEGKAKKKEQLDSAFIEIRTKQMKRAKEFSANANWFENEAIRNYDANIEETKTDVHTKAVETKRKYERMKKIEEEEHRRRTEELNDVNLKMMQLEEDLFSELKRNHQKRVEEREKLYNLVDLMSRSSHHHTLWRIDDQFEKTANLMDRAFYTAASNGFAKDTTIKEMHETVSRMEEYTGKIGDWMIENEFSRHKDGMSPVHSNSHVNQALMYVKSMSEDCSLLATQITHIGHLMTNSPIADELIRAKTACGSAHHQVSLLNDELANLRYALVKCHTVNLDVIKRGLVDLDHSIYSIYNKILLETQEIMQEEIYKVIEGENYGFNRDTRDTEEKW